MQLKATVNPVSSKAPQDVFPNGRKNCSISGLNTENLHLSPTNGKSAVEGPVLNIGDANSFDRTPATRKGLLDRESDTGKNDGSSVSKLHFLSTNIARNPILNSSQRNPLRNNASGVSNVKLLKTGSVQKPELSSVKAVGERIRLLTNTSGPKVQKLLSTASISESKLERKSEKKMGLHSTSGVPSVPALSMPLLKRKLLQETHADPALKNQLKKMSRNRSEILTQTNKKVRETGKPKENSETICVEQKASVDFPDDKNVMDPDVNVKKAAYSKELDDICNTLKKKQEQAQVLVVRAIVNRNSLLMLNQPEEEEKIRCLQRTTANLVSKHQGLSLSSFHK